MTIAVIYLIRNTEPGRTLDVIPAFWFTIAAFGFDLTMLTEIIYG